MTALLGYMTAVLGYMTAVLKYLNILLLAVWEYARIILGIIENNNLSEIMKQNQLIKAFLSLCLSLSKSTQYLGKINELWFDLTRLATYLFYNGKSNPHCVTMRM